MKTVTSQEFLTVYGGIHIPEPKKHHFTGPSRYHQEEGHGAVWHEEGRILFSLAACLGGDVLEIGTNLAISTRYISEGLDLRGKGQVWTIDCDQWWTYREDWPRIIPLNMHSRYMPRRKYRWAFIDGNHEYEGVKEDIPIALECGCTHLLFHDAKTWPGVKKAFLEAFNEDEWDLFEIDTGCGLLFAQRKINAAKD